MPRFSSPTESVTILDVAARAGVSYGTVSRVLNDDAHVRPTTRARVQAAMVELGYTVNRQARVLAGGSTHTIGVLVPDLGTGYIGEIMRGIDTELTLSNYDLILYTTHRIASKESNYVAEMAQGMADGLLIVLPRNPTDYIDRLSGRNFPFVLIDHHGVGADCASVGATNWQGMYTAAEYLIRLGHERIGFISGTLDLGASVDRLNGFKSAFRTHHLILDESLLVSGTFMQPDGYAAANALLDLPRPPTAILASNDVMAMGAMDAVRNRGLRIPEDISILGFDDIPQAAMVRPTLTTVRQPLEQMGRVATQMLLDRLAHPEKKAHRVELPTELILRESTASPKNGAG